MLTKEDEGIDFGGGVSLGPELSRFDDDTNPNLKDFLCPCMYKLKNNRPSWPSQLMAHFDTVQRTIQLWDTCIVFL